MKKLLSLFLVMSILQYNYAQNVCSENKDLLITDINEVSVNKCTIKKKESSPNKEIKVQSKFSTRRYFKRRKKEKKEAVRLNLSSKEILNLTKEFTPEELTTVKSKITSVSKALENKEVISFLEIEEIPQFYSCQDTDFVSEDCFNYEMKKHIQENFEYPNEEVSGDVLVSFVINTEGIVENVEIKADKKIKKTKEEIEKVMLLLPKFIPGKHKGISTNVSYSFPMSFN